jgi:hypothetical protein
MTDTWTQSGAIVQVRSRNSGITELTISGDRMQVTVAGFPVSVTRQ